MNIKEYKGLEPDIKTELSSGIYPEGSATLLWYKSENCAYRETTLAPWEEKEDKKDALAIIKGIFGKKKNLSASARRPRRRQVKRNPSSKA